MVFDSSKTYLVRSEIKVRAKSIVEAQGIALECMKQVEKVNVLLPDSKTEVKQYGVIAESEAQKRG